MRMIAFTTVALMAMIVTYAFGLSGAVAAVVFLFVLANGILDRWARPLLERLRA
jgi:hypothetical protein